MTTTRLKLGQRGEQIAAAYLEQHGCAIIARNWYCPYGELDIIARQGDTVLVVEVRTRRAETDEDALASISRGKQQKLQRAAQLYLSEHDLDAAAWRIDVIAVALPKSGPPRIAWVRDACAW